MLNGVDLLGGDCEGLGAKGVADEEAEVCLCVWGLCAGNTKGTGSIRNAGLDFRTIFLSTWGVGQGGHTPTVDRAQGLVAVNRIYGGSLVARCRDRGPAVVGG